VSSPIGKALSGRKTGEEVTVRIPAGTRVLEIVRLKTMHEKEEES